MDTTIIMPLFAVARGWEAFESIGDILRDRGIEVGQLRFLYGGHVMMVGVSCLTATFAVMRE